MSFRYLITCGALVALACSTPTENAAPARPTFVIEVSGEEFRIQVTDVQQAAALRGRLRAGTRGVISGDLMQGSGGFNAPWRWHMDPATVHVADLAIELCDGRPSMVDADLTYWLGSVRRFCPWGAKVLREE